MGQELERKFVLEQKPDFPLGKPANYRQGYIDNPVGLVVRPRQEGEKLVLQLKRRTETPGHNDESPPLDLTGNPDIFAALLEWADLSEKSTVEKDRYDLTERLSADEGVIECVLDEFRGRLQGHLLLEVEFASPDFMESWQPPHWLRAAGAREVTGNPAYNNESIALSGWPMEDDA